MVWPGFAFPRMAKFPVEALAFRRGTQALSNHDGALAPDSSSAKARVHQG